MRNALRKIAALQAKPQPRSRASSSHTSAFVSSRVSSEEGAAAADPSRDASPGGVPDAVQRNITQVLAASDPVAHCCWPGMCAKYTYYSVPPSLPCAGQAYLIVHCVLQRAIFKTLCRRSCREDLAASSSHLVLDSLYP